MAGKGTAPNNGKELEDKVVQVAQKLGLQTMRQVSVARRIWGAVRMIDVVLTDPATRLRLGVECKFQGVGGSAEEKIPAIVEDIDAWPIRGIIVISGDGFSANMRSFLFSTGKVVELEDLESWLRLFFGLDV
ncbi:MAG TPA: hypothetical protein PKK50_06710 [Myxococcota bacterium]|nr:hypothetical protein [Myxococcota bacterium]HNZ03814.1 hypothetical protein [Myxococcota bacterium]HOD08578.1 hypothetical protein [Myxococcota bacterium]